MDTHVINPFMPCGLFYLNPLYWFISYIGAVSLVFIIVILVEIYELNGNIVGPGQTPRFAASDLGSTLIASVPFRGR